MKYVNIGILILLLLFTGFCNAQLELTGKVVNSKNKPVTNVQIFLDSIDTHVKTDKKGIFKVDVPEHVSMINVFSKKYGLLSAVFHHEKVMNFVFANDSKTKTAGIKKNEMVSIGYSEVEQKYLVNNVQRLDEDKAQDFSRYRSIYDIIRGRFPGVTVTNQNKIIIRGVNSVRNIADPLFVVDGVIVSSIDYISPINVKDITILKDAASSIYGSMATGGVVQITTKIKD